VEYPADDQLLERAARTRRTRIAGQPDS
jgi:hypothetical protein